ncbi:uncharacterized protein TNIN_292531 [Trichonephila inaurata madagascariensis]|uniref:Uncharacterized protein n=1 Tax=Trichonephila inaurata madagascariensis TaxID=2747483 RepID=A0A8X7BSA7_9ARAC|nr:uncharacterized protein TNIN_292531 [Trichonephila inaurata madagascariensis]
MSEDDENSVVYIDCDASTMTGTYDSGNKRRRNQGSEAFEFKYVNSPSEKVMESNMIKFLSGHEIGNKSSEIFSSGMLTWNSRRMNTKRFKITAQPEIQISECEFIRNGLNSHSIVGMWSGAQYDAILYKIELNLQSRCTCTENEVQCIVKDFELVGPFYSRYDIRDIRETFFRDNNYVLYIGSNNKPDSERRHSVMLYHSNGNTTGMQYLTARELYCCNGNQNGHTFAAGAEEGVFVYHSGDLKLYNDLNRVNSVEFNRAGNVLYCGIEKPALAMYDLREYPTICHYLNISGLCTMGMVDSHLLANENNMLISGFDGSLSQIDLRKSETVVKYPSHARSSEKAPFSFSESADLVCATGTDKLTRLWSLRTGEQLCTIEPKNKSRKVHSCLKYIDRQWAVILFQKNMMYVAEPMI